MFCNQDQERLQREQLIDEKNQLLNCVANLNGQIQQLNAHHQLEITRIRLEGQKTIVCYFLLPSQMMFQMCLPQAQLLVEHERDRLTDEMNYLNGQIQHLNAHHQQQFDFTKAECQQTIVSFCYFKFAQMKFLFCNQDQERVQRKQLIDEKNRLLNYVANLNGQIQHFNAHHQQQLDFTRAECQQNIVSFCY